MVQYHQHIHIGDIMNKEDRFWQWFGDSKVVDEEGYPTVLFHGTSRDFSSFSISTFGETSGYHAADVGFFATAIPELASMYADKSAKGGFGQNIMPIFVSIKNPMFYETSSQYYRHIDLLKKNGISGKEWRERLESEGFDGIIVRDDKEEVIAFRPEQIKSAIGNIGLFNPNSPSLTDHPMHEPKKTKEKVNRISKDTSFDI